MSPQSEAYDFRRHTTKSLCAEASPKTMARNIAEMNTTLHLVTGSSAYAEAGDYFMESRSYPCTSVKCIWVDFFDLVAPRLWYPKMPTFAAPGISFCMDAPLF